jgi:hypothetical protein
MQAVKKEYSKLELSMTSKYEEIQVLVGKFNQVRHGINTKHLNTCTEFRGGQINLM